MDPTIQLIQLMLTVERDEEARRHPHMAYKDDLADEKPVCLPAHKRDNRIKRIFNLPHRQQSCECV